jgi:hypothetical protein
LQQPFNKIVELRVADPHIMGTRGAIIVQSIGLERERKRKRFEGITALRKDYPVSTLCQGVSRRAIMPIYYLQSNWFPDAIN